MAQNGKNLLNGMSRSGQYFTWDGALKQLTYLTTNSSYTSSALKIQLYNGNTYVSQIKTQSTQGNGYVTFTKDSTWNKLNVGFNGSSQDGRCLFDCSGLTNGATYTLTWNIQSFTWKEWKGGTYQTGAIFSYLVLSKGSTAKYWSSIVSPIACWADLADGRPLPNQEQTVVADDNTTAGSRTYTFAGKTYTVYAYIVSEPTQTYVEGQSVRYVDLEET